MAQPVATPEDSGRKRRTWIALPAGGLAIGWGLDITATATFILPRMTQEAVDQRICYLYEFSLYVSSNIAALTANFLP